MHTEWFGDALSGIPILKVGICKEKKKKAENPESLQGTQGFQGSFCGRLLGMSTGSTGTEVPRDPPRPSSRAPPHPEQLQGLVPALRSICHFARCTCCPVSVLPRFPPCLFSLWN